MPRVLRPRTAALAPVGQNPPNPRIVQNQVQLQGDARCTPCIKSDSSCIVLTNTNRHKTTQRRCLRCKERFRCDLVDRDLKAIDHLEKGEMELKAAVNLLVELGAEDSVLGHETSDSSEAEDGRGVGAARRLKLERAGGNQKRADQNMESKGQPGSMSQVESGGSGRPAAERRVDSVRESAQSAQRKSSDWAESDKEDLTRVVEDGDGWETEGENDASIEGQIRAIARDVGKAVRATHKFRRANGVFKGDLDC